MANSVKKTEALKPQTLRIPIVRWFNRYHSRGFLQAFMGPARSTPKLPKPKTQAKDSKGQKSQKQPTLKLPFELNCKSTAKQANKNTTMNPAASMTPMTPGSTDQSMEPRVQNIVATVNLCCDLDLKRIALHARNAEYNPKRLAAVIMRIRKPCTTALIFESGKMVCTGAKNEEDSRVAARKYARIIQKIGFPAKFMNYKIQNIVGAWDMKCPISLEYLALVYGKFCSYEPELFPGIIYRLVCPRVVLLIFASGKIVLTGAKVQQEIYDAFEKILPILKMLKKKSENASLPSLN